jgi:hypothetical protein
MSLFSSLISPLPISPLSILLVEIILGAVLGGYLIERFPANKVLCFTLLLCALGMFALPLCKDIVSLTLTIAAGGFTMGY